MRSTRGLPAAVGAAVAALAMATLGACTGGGASGGSATARNPAAAGSTVSPAPPGKYKTLPQPCVAVDPDTLKTLVPGAADYAGTEAPTYDADRRVGCAWRSRTDDGTARSLSIDFERVVSYDPAISDEVQAQQDFLLEATDAHISLPPASGTATPTAPTGTATGSADGNGTNGDTSGTNSSGGTGSGGSDDSGNGSGSNGSSADGSPALVPRTLTDIGDTAFLDDVLKHPANAARRDVTVVFRTANVLVTVVYSQTSPRGGEQPHSAGLQKGAQDVAAQLERKIER